MCRSVRKAASELLQSAEAAPNADQAATTGGRAAAGGQPPEGPPAAGVQGSSVRIMRLQTQWTTPHDGSGPLVVVLAAAQPGVLIHQRLPHLAALNPMPGKPGFERCPSE